MVAINTFRKLRPMLATSAEPFNSKDFIYEVKWDGFRCLSYLGEETILQSRSGLDFTRKFPELAGINKLARRRPVIVDGEIIIMDAGLPSFYELQKRSWTQDSGSIAAAAAKKPATYIVFDILYAGGDKLISLPLAERREILRSLIEPGKNLLLSEGIYEQGVEFYRACIDRNLEGVVAKKLDSVYVPGKRSTSWFKFKKALAGDFVICGYKQTHKGSKRVDSLLLGCYCGGSLAFQGIVGVGLGGVTGQKLYNLLHPLQRDVPLFGVPKEIVRGLTWTEPITCCTVEFLEPAKDGGLRHPVFKGIREDLTPQECSGIAGATVKRAD